MHICIYLSRDLHLSYLHHTHVPLQPKRESEEMVLDDTIQFMIVGSPAMGIVPCDSPDNEKNNVNALLLKKQAL